MKKIRSKKTTLDYSPGWKNLWLTTSFDLGPNSEIEVEGLIENIKNFYNRFAEFDWEMAESLGDIRIEDGQAFTKDVYKILRRTISENFNLADGLFNISVRYFSDRINIETFFKQDDIETQEAFYKALKLVTSFHKACYEIDIREIPLLGAQLDLVEKAVISNLPKTAGWSPKVISN